MATIVVDAENVRRSVWPNIRRHELDELCDAWGADHGHDVTVVWEGERSADDTIVDTVRALTPPVWVVTSDRELRARVGDAAERIIGGGSFARALRSLDRGG
jgi:hypothetical protein